MRSGMGVNASILGLTHYEDLSLEILQLVVAELRKPVDDGSSWPLLSKVCKDWRHAAGKVVTTLRMDCQGREWDSPVLYLQYPKLQRLSVFGGVSYRFLAQFENLPDLRELKLQPDTYRKLLVKDNDSMLFAKLTHLTRLEICRPAPWTGRLECGRWEDEIVTLTQLHRLELTRCQEEAFEGIAVSNLSKLGSLRLGVIDDPSMADIRLNFSKLQKLLALTELHVTYPEKYLWGPTLAQIRDLDQLKILHISNPRYGSFTNRLMLGVTLMKHLVSLHVEVNSINYANYEDDLPEPQEMPCLEYMTWTASDGTFPAVLLRLAQTMMKENKLKGYVIEDSCGVHIA